jgi:hypothetical protein
VAIPKEKRKKRGTASHQYGAPHAMALVEDMPTALSDVRSQGQNGKHSH